MTSRIGFLAAVSASVCFYVRRSCLLAVLVCVSASSALADTSERQDVGVPQRFPAGSITSDELADRALSDVEAERAAIERRYAEEAQTCYGRFFASVCLEKTKESRRADLEKLRPVEVEANTFKRRARVAERDAALREKQANADAAPATTVQPRAESAAATPRVAPKENVAATKQPKSAPTPPNKAGASERVARHEEKIKRAEEEAAADAQKRAENTAAYQRKGEESQARQRELEKRKQEKAREREREAKQVPGTN